MRVLTPETHEMEREGYRANAGDRCYFCKAELLDVLSPLAAEHGLPTSRPAPTPTTRSPASGPASARRTSAAPSPRCATPGSPSSRSARRRAQWGLPTWDKPAAACLSSRVAYGIEVSPHRLARVERAEAAVRAALATAGIAVRNLRVRDLGDRASLEVDQDRVAEVDRLPGTHAALRDAGFAEAAVDPRGFRSGSMNELLVDADRYR